MVFSVVNFAGIPDDKMKVSITCVFMKEFCNPFQLFSITTFTLTPSFGTV